MSFVKTMEGPNVIRTLWTSLPPTPGGLDFFLEAFCGYPSVPMQVEMSKAVEGSRPGWHLILLIRLWYDLSVAGREYLRLAITSPPRLQCPTSGGKPAVARRPSPVRQSWDRNLTAFAKSPVYNYANSVGALKHRANKGF